jgi:hypothetical protein
VNQSKKKKKTQLEGMGGLFKLWVEIPVLPLKQNQQTHSIEGNYVILQVFIWHSRI